MITIIIMQRIQTKQNKHLTDNAVFIIDNTHTLS